jgi:putative DNA primase/helicase
MTIEEVKQRVNDLAQLTPIEYEAVRIAASERTGMRPGVLDREVAKLRPKEEDDSLAGTALVIADVEPWDEIVQLSALLNELTHVFRDYIIFQDEYDADMLALWVVVTYCVEIFNIAPLVGVSAMSKDSGKTSLLRILLHLVRKGKGTISLTVATAFRIVDKYHPTLIADEVDKWLKNNPELLTIFLAGHEREFSRVERCVGDDNDIREFDCFGPKAWGQIGLPDGQLVSRSNVVNLLKKKSSEVVKSWPESGMPDEVKDVFLRLRRQATRWVQDNQDAIKASRPDVSGLTNRLKDNWYPLLVIANLAGDEWRKRALAAAGVEAVIDEDGEAVILLRDIRNIFFTRKIDRIPSTLLLADLLRQDESPWPHYERQPEGLSPHQLGHKLSSMKIKSKGMRFDKQLILEFGGEKNFLKGYELKWFSNMFERQLAGEEPEEVAVHVQRANEQQVI